MLSVDGYGKAYEWFRRGASWNQLVESYEKLKAMPNTSITINFGFSILILSNFIPTILFGLFTGLAMLVALLAVLTLLPKLILVYKPFGEEISELN